jgi:hypothetical protein
MARSLEIMNHQIISNNYLRMSARKMTKEQRKHVDFIVMNDYFTNEINTPAAIEKRTGVKFSTITWFLRNHIIPGADLKELKKKYTS